jgi:UPF0716 protein FxsA
MLTGFLTAVGAMVLEVYVFLQISHAIGLGGAILLLVAVSLVGAQLVKREGLSAWRRIQDALARQQMPGRELIDGSLILLAGVLLLLPGFVTDAVGLLLLLPPVRAAARGAGRLVLARRIETRVVRRLGDERVIDR